MLTTLRVVGDEITFALLVRVPVTGVERFESREAFAGYREDPRRAEQAHLLSESGAAIELLEVDDA
jgi:hypothetical protein